MSSKSEVTAGRLARARRVPRLGFVCAGQTKTKHSMAADCDINNIMKKFEKHGILEHVAKHQAQYGDFIAAPQSYHEAMDQVVKAQEAFLSLPAKVRARFSNDPGEFLEFVGDPANEAELVKLGLARPRSSPADSAQPAPAGARQGAVGEPGTTPEGSKASTTGGSQKAS